MPSTCENTVSGPLSVLLMAGEINRTFLEIHMGVGFKTIKMFIPFNLAILLLEIYPEETIQNIFKCHMPDNVCPHVICFI